MSRCHTCGGLKRYTKRNRRRSNPSFRGAFSSARKRLKERIKRMAKRSAEEGFLSRVLDRPDVEEIESLQPMPMPPPMPSMYIPPSTCEPEPLPQAIDSPVRRLLYVGGDQRNLRPWMEDMEVVQISNISESLADELGEFRPDVIITSVAGWPGAPATRPSSDTLYLTENYSKRHCVPYFKITPHQGWPRIAERAREKGLHWLADLLKDEGDYVPPRRKRLPKPQTAARIRHNARRRARFAERGIVDSDVRYATPEYKTSTPGDVRDNCTLCGTRIKYLFRLLFDRPREWDPIIFWPVGSTCITDWMEALPDSKERDDALDRLDIEIEKQRADEREHKNEAAKERRRKKREAQEAEVAEEEIEETEEEARQRRLEELLEGVDDDSTEEDWRRNPAFRGGSPRSWKSKDITLKHKPSSEPMLEDDSYEVVGYPLSIQVLQPEIIRDEYGVASVFEGYMVGKYVEKDGRSVIIYKAPVATLREAVDQCAEIIKEEGWKYGELTMDDWGNS